MNKFFMDIALGMAVGDLSFFFASTLFSSRERDIDDVIIQLQKSTLFLVFLIYGLAT